MCEHFCLSVKGNSYDRRLETRLLAFFFVCGRRGIYGDSVVSAQIATSMQIHIGNLIRDELRRSGHTNQWLADQIGITPRALQKLFNKTSIDTQQLLAISRALGVDLFACYSESVKESPYNSHE